MLLFAITSEQYDFYWEKEITKSKTGTMLTSSCREIFPVSFSWKTNLKKFFISSRSFMSQRLVSRSCQISWSLLQGLAWTSIMDSDLLSATILKIKIIEIFKEISIFFLSFLLGAVQKIRVKFLEPFWPPPPPLC